jgi:hypothetical protein
MIRFQRLESLAILIALLAVYSEFNFSWMLFVLFILFPDVFMVGYLKNPRIGAIIYNIGHSYFSPIALWFLSHHFESSTWIALAIIWAIHIAGDRMLGFGLKLPTGFKETHLGILK